MESTSVQLEMKRMQVEEFVDLRSDTVTLPTEKALNAVRSVVEDLHRNS